MLGLAGAGALGLLGCGGSDSATPSTTTGTTTPPTATTTTAACSIISEETAGRFPLRGSTTANSSFANALALIEMVRSDIRSSFAGATGTAAGVPLAVTVELVNTNAICADQAGWVVYLWHCDREGRYSMYSSGVTNQNYLRGLQETGADGTVTFTTIFPGCRGGRMPHIHFRGVPQRQCSCVVLEQAQDFARRRVVHRRADIGRQRKLRQRECRQP